MPLGGTREKRETDCTKPSSLLLLLVSVTSLLKKKINATRNSLELYNSWNDVVRKVLLPLTTSRETL